MADLIEILESFNRKEMFFLVGEALGNRDFKLCDEFKSQLGAEVGVEIPCKDVFVATEYHLNWIHASLVLWHCQGKAQRVHRLQTEGALKDNKEDVDLLIAFRSGNGYHLIFVEAKGYETDGFAYFEKKQLESKVNRLEKILSPDGKEYEGIKSYYCLMSGYKPTNLGHQSWPTWDGQPLRWLKLPLPSERFYVNHNPSKPMIIKMTDVGNLRSFQLKKVVPKETD